MESVTFKMRELVEAQPAFQELSETKLRAGASFQLARIIKVVQKELQAFSERRDEIARKYGNAKEDGSYEIPEEKVGEAQAEFDELLDTELSLTFDPLSVPTLGDAEIKPAMFVVLERFIQE